MNDQNQRPDRPPELQQTINEVNDYRQAVNKGFEDVAEKHKEQPGGSDEGVRNEQDLFNAVQDTIIEVLSDPGITTYFALITDKLMRLGNLPKEAKNQPNCPAIIVQELTALITTACTYACVNAFDLYSSQFRRALEQDFKAVNEVFTTLASRVEAISTGNEELKEQLAICQAKIADLETGSIVNQLPQDN